MTRFKDNRVKSVVGAMFTGVGVVPDPFDQSVGEEIVRGVGGGGLGDDVPVVLDDGSNTWELRARLYVEVLGAKVNGHDKGHWSVGQGCARRDKENSSKCQGRLSEASRVAHSEAERANQVDSSEYVKDEMDELGIRDRGVVG